MDLCPNCTYQEVGKSKGKVKGYVKTQECDSCRDKRMSFAAQMEKDRRKDKIAMRLAEIDQEAGPRAVREALIGLGKKGYNDKIQTLEDEAVSLRAELISI